MRVSAAEARALGLNIVYEPRKKGKRKQKAPGATGLTPEQKLFDAACVANGIPIADHEYPFAESIGRKWRFDHCWPGMDLGVIVLNGIHPVRELRNEAAIEGWYVLVVTKEEVQNGVLFDLLKKALLVE